jgi:hypothetical protein
MVCPNACMCMQPPTDLLPAVSFTISKSLQKSISSNLSKADVIANRRALEIPLSVLLERAAAPVLDKRDCTSVARALSAMIVDEASSTAAVLEAATLKLPLLQYLATMWKRLAVCFRLSLLVTLVWDCPWFLYSFCGLFSFPCVGRAPLQHCVVCAVVSLCTLSLAALESGVLWHGH